MLNGVGEWGESLRSLLLLRCWIHEVLERRRQRQTKNFRDFEEEAHGTHHWYVTCSRSMVNGSPNCSMRTSSVAANSVRVRNTS